MLGEPLLQISTILAFDIPDSIFVTHHDRGLAAWLHAPMPGPIKERRTSLPVANLLMLKDRHRPTTARTRLTDIGQRNRIRYILRHNASSYHTRRRVRPRTIRSLAFQPRGGGHGTPHFANCSRVQPPRGVLAASISAFVGRFIF
jgi:hypothetical protein